MLKGILKSVGSLVDKPRTCFEYELFHPEQCTWCWLIWTDAALLNDVQFWIFLHEHYPFRVCQPSLIITKTEFTNDYLSKRCHCSWTQASFIQLEKSDTSILNHFCKPRISSSAIFNVLFQHQERMRPWWCWQRRCAAGIGMNYNIIDFLPFPWWCEEGATLAAF